MRIAGTTFPKLCFSSVRQAAQRARNYVKEARTPLKFDFGAVDDRERQIGEFSVYSTMWDLRKKTSGACGSLITGTYLSLLAFVPSIVWNISAGRVFSTASEMAAFLLPSLALSVFTASQGIITTWTSLKLGREIEDGCGRFSAIMTSRYKTEGEPVPDHFQAIDIHAYSRLRKMFYGRHEEADVLPRQFAADPTLTPEKELADFYRFKLLDYLSQEFADSIRWLGRMKTWAIVSGAAMFGYLLFPLVFLFDIPPEQHFIYFRATALELTAYLLSYGLLKKGLGGLALHIEDAYDYYREIMLSRYKDRAFPDIFENISPPHLARLKLLTTASARTR